MDIVRFSAPRAGRVFAALGILTASVASAAIPALVSADTITTRSIALGDSTKGATTSYKVDFTTVGASTGVIEIDFCDTAVIGGACTPPATLDTSTVGASLTGALAGTASATNSGKGVKIVPTAAITPAGTVSFSLTGIKNPTTPQTMYARIVTYVDNAAYTANYVDQDTLGATHLDDGSVALTITDGFSVNGSVLETLTFCATGDAALTGGTTATDCSANQEAPNIKLGANGILDDLAGTDGDVLTFLATNAAGGAVVNLKSDAVNCGGLYRDGVSNTTNCGIGPIGNGTAAAALANSAAKFGAKLTLSQPAGTPANGTLVESGAWNATTYNMPFTTGADPVSGVTSVYGAPVYNTSGKPTNLGGGKLSFNANRSSLTPAGNYTAKFSLIATGTF